MARVAEGFGVAWHTANDAVLTEGERVLINDPARYHGVRGLGVDAHVWRHTRTGDKHVTVVIDLTPIRDGTGFKSATTEELPDAAAVMDPFHVVRLATPWTVAVAGSSRICMAIAASGTIRFAGRGGPCTQMPGCSPTSNGPGSQRCAIDAHVEVEASWGSTGR